MKLNSAIINKNLTLFKFLTILCFLGPVTSLSDDDVLHINMQNSMQAKHKLVTLKPDSKYRFEASAISLSSGHLLFQCHCQKRNVTMMYHDNYSYNSAVEGSSVGLASFLNSGQRVASVWLVSDKTHDSQCFITVVPHSNYDPVPGGCNIEFNVETAPFLRVKYNLLQTVLEYQSASFGHKRGQSDQPLCDKSLYYINYEFYVLFLEENNYKFDEFSSGLTKAMTAESLQKHAQSLNPFAKSPVKRIFFSIFPGQGVIYNIVAKYTVKANSSRVVYRSAYVPNVIYGCSFDDEIDGCYSINRTFTYVFCIGAAVFGLILCFAGHYFFKLEMFCCGFLAASLIAFILLIKYTSWTHTDREILTMVIGVAGGLIWLAVWWFFGIPLLSILLAGFELGYLVSATILFTPIGDLSILRNNFNFWMTFAIGIIFIPVIFLYFTKFLSILFCSIIGSFGVIVAVDRYIRTTLSYIILNVVKRSIYGSMDRVNEVLPFQTNDIILSVTWVLLSIIGIFVQYRITKKCKPFPECPYKVWNECNQSQTFNRSGGPRNFIRRLRNFNSNNNEVDPLIHRSADRSTESYGAIH